MEEEKTQEEKTTVEPNQKVNNDKEITVSSKLLCMLCAVISLAILIICKICIKFGAGNGTFYGIMSIFIYVLPLLGTVFTFTTEKTPTTELWINVAVLAIALLTF